MHSRLRLVPSIIVVLLVAALAVFAPIIAHINIHPAAAWVVQMTLTHKSDPDLSHKVWINKRLGIYYCRESKFYGKLRPGFYMQQGKALQIGYRPSEGRLCQ